MSRAMESCKAALHSLGTVISYCTNDARFIDRCIEEAKKFSQQIVISVCDHFFDGSPENQQLLHATYAKHPDCLFVEFSYLSERLYSRYHSLSPEDKDWTIYWAATTRYIGLHYLDQRWEYVFFLDSDEIAEGKKMKEWLDSGAYLDFAAQRLAAYYYALKPNLRAKQVVNLPLLTKRSTLGPLTLINGLERIGAYQTHPGPKREEVVGLDGMPLIHHYSWVRTKEECLRKARTWGHRNDEDWPKLIEETFQGKRLFNLDLEFEEILDPYFDPFADRKTGEKIGSFQNVIKINDQDLFRKELEFV